MLIQRDILPKLEKWIAHKEIIALVGLRQVGKTTLLKEIQKKCKNSIFISLEDVSILNLFENSIDEFIKIYILPFDYIFIDEVQYSKNSGQRLKFIYDKFENKKIFISGSSKSELAIHSLSRLVGRVIIFEILPVSFSEFVRFKSKEKYRLLNQDKNSFVFDSLKVLFEEYLQFGGYPEIILEKDETIKKEKLKNIVNTYILKELVEILGYRNSFEFENLIRRLAIQDGGILNKSNLSNELGINRNKIDEMINVLDKTGIIQIIYPYLKNKTKQIVKSPKVYFRDIGFKNSLLNNFNKLNLRQDKGQIYENFVLNALYKNNFSPEFFRIEEENEVDFILEKDGKILGIECKSKLKSMKIPKATKKFIDLYLPDKVLVLNENIYGEMENILFSDYLEVLREDLL